MVVCLECGVEIPNPRIEKGKVMQKFCDSKCRDKFNNRSKRTKDLIREIRELLERSGVWGKISIAFGLILKKYHIEVED